MTALTLPRTLTDPGEGVAAAVQGRRILWPLLALMAATAFAGAAFALRWDPAPGILQKLEMAGQLKGMPEAELVEQITTAGRLKLVTGIASGVVPDPAGGARHRDGARAGRLAPREEGPVPCAVQRVRRRDAPGGASSRALWGLVALCQLGVTEERARHLLPSSLGGVGPRGARTLAPAPRLARSLPAPRRAAHRASGFAAATGHAAALPGCGWGWCSSWPSWASSAWGFPGMMPAAAAATGPARGGPRGGG